jgi:two-component system sensor histidine kinase BaeS
MRTKLFFAFILFIFLTVISNVVFEHLIIGDFNDFLKGTEEDHIYWILASVEGSYKDNIWNRSMLFDALHWGLMLGFEMYVEDNSGNGVLSSKDVLSTMKPNMLKRMDSLMKLPDGIGEFTWYPLYVEGGEIGTLYVRPLERLGLIPLKEEVFRGRGREFLIISFLISGGGALLLAVLFTLFISNPIRRLTIAAEKIAKGDFSLQKPERKRSRLFPYRDEIERLTETFQYMAEALEREDALRKHLTSNVAHELRTPLTIIRGNLEAIEDGVISDPREAIKDISAEIKRLVSLVEGIEDITRAEASFFKKGSMEKVNLKEFIGTLVSGMKKLFEEKELYLKTVGSSVNVQTYPDKLHIVLNNLLTNAYKFTGTGGITIQWDTVNNRGKTGFSISVKDTGEGIPEEQLPRIFERFYKSTTSVGRGLGLSIVKELTEIMGGKVDVQSTVGKGSCFIVKF